MDFASSILYVIALVVSVLALAITVGAAAGALALSAVFMVKKRVIRYMTGGVVSTGLALCLVSLIAGLSFDLTENEHQEHNHALANATGDFLR